MTITHGSAPRFRTHRRATLALVILAIATTGSSCHHDITAATGGPHTPSGHSVLFLGNSLTFENNLPGVLAAIAKQAGDTIDAWSWSLPDYALIDHYHTPVSISTIQSYHWEYVILQQGPSTLSLSRDTLILGAQLLSQYIRAVGAKPALFMVWPDITRQAFFDDCRASYQAAAQAVNGVFMPAGVARGLGHRPVTAALQQRRISPDCTRHVGSRARDLRARDRSRCAQPARRCPR